MLLDNCQNLFSGLQRTLGLWYGGSGEEQCPSDARIIALVALPTMEGTVERPREWAAAVLGFEDVDGSVVGDEVPNHLYIAVPGSEVECGLAVLHCGAGRPAGREKLMNGAGVVAQRHTDDATGGVA
jgi:hypothetical protein